MNGITNFTSKMRLTGLSGLDTDSMVAELMKAERIPLDTLKQKKTLVQWKQEAYRSVSSSLMGFKSKFFDIVNRSSYLLSENSIKAKTIKLNNSDYFSATASGNATVGSQSVKVIKLAESAKSVSEGAEGVSKAITGTLDNTHLGGKKIVVSLDGVSKEITLENYADENEFATKFQEALNKAFGESKLKVDLSYNSANGKYNFSLDTVNGATKVTVNQPSGTSGGLGSLGLTNGASNRISLKSTLLSVRNSLGTPLTFNDGGMAVFTINGKTFTANPTDTLEKVFEKINNDADANVTIGYDEMTDKITLSSKQTGAGETLKMADNSGSFLSALGLGTVTEGQDAEILINGNQTVVRSTNNFTVNGVNYSLKKAHDASSTGETLSVEQDTESVIKNIKSFIEDYNKLIDDISGKTKEKYDRDYQPLTDEQKEGMEEKDIEAWEKKAKAGILRSDSILQQITLSMRKALYEKVEGVGISLRDIGIESRSYNDNGKLYLEEDKLQKALLEKPDEVAKLLTGTSSQHPTYSRNFTISEKQVRYNQSGLFHRISDIIEDNVSTIRSEKGYKGILLEKAGIENDVSNTQNTLADELDNYDDRIDSLIDKLIRKEENYYLKFSNLEIMLNKMNQQSAWLTSQFSSGQG